ncbi:MAG: hypothetical protein DMG72_14625 [Acidobacteria bacterium]|nr:MAG: hypothetical protein DMG72_14625 [Acidobacteriota bacterium]
MRKGIFCLTIASSNAVAVRPESKLFGNLTPPYFFQFNSSSSHSWHCESCQRRLLYAQLERRKPMSDLNQDDIRIRVQRVRRVTGSSQYRVAKKAGMGRTRLSLFENGPIDLRPEELEALQRALRDTVGRRISEFELLSEDLAASATATA